MSNDEKTTTVAEVQANNKEVEESQQKNEESAPTVTKTIDGEVENGKTQQVDAEADAPANNAAATAAATPAVAAPKPAKVSVHKADFEKDVVYLYQFSRTANIPSPSCFCLKVETWLRMSGIKYQVSLLGNYLSVNGQK